MEGVASTPAGAFGGGVAAVDHAPTPLGPHQCFVCAPMWSILNERRNRRKITLDPSPTLQQGKTVPSPGTPGTLLVSLVELCGMRGSWTTLSQALDRTR